MHAPWRNCDRFPGGLQENDAVEAGGWVWSKQFHWNILNDKQTTISLHPNDAVTGTFPYSSVPEQFRS
jgi:hypothetical protein